MADTPAVPLTLEGSSVLHQILRVRWSVWRALSASHREHVIAQAAEALGDMEQGGRSGSALYSVLGHKGDLMLVHFRPSFEQLEAVQRQVRKLQLFEYLEQITSYLSVVELGLYESTQKTYNSLSEQGIEPHSPDWNAAIEETLKRQREAMAPRLIPEIPAARYICFYPMDRKRGESKNWYQEPMADRIRMMHEHGMIGRRYAGEVRQIISGSIGFDDWEWGVDLFAEDPLVFKKLIYEMRFDEVSAVYALFGTFVIGLRLPSSGLGGYLALE
ncbi:MAG: hydrogen peroxide-dependent heme synthase [Bryobacteraceae bacterium]|nr:hydrogen peroxide-dependent heme synthase [Bryobacteraceae bacterium]